MLFCLVTSALKVHRLVSTPALSIMYSSYWSLVLFICIFTPTFFFLYFCTKQSRLLSAFICSDFAVLVLKSLPVLEHREQCTNHQAVQLLVRVPPKSYKSILNML